MTHPHTTQNDPSQPIQRALGHSEPLIEEGNAFARLHGHGERTATRSASERFDVIVIGAGQAGLSVGYYLAKSGLRFVLLDANARIGDAWRKRWDSLRLFTPAHLDGLDGMPFPSRRDYFPTKDEMADYLEAYATRFQLPVRCGVKVARVHKQDGRYVVDTDSQRLEATHVVIAMASYQRPRVPDFASQLDPSITQMHSTEYQRPDQLQPGAVLLAGAGNSGSELAVELGRTHRVTMAGRDTGKVFFRIRSWLGRHVLCRILLRGVFHRLLTLSTPFGRKARPFVLGQGGPLIRVRPEDLARVGVERAPRVVGVRDGKPLLEDGRVLDVRNVIWSTGFHPGFSFVDLPVFGEDGQPRQTRGVVDDETGLYFVGLMFLYAMSSSMIHGVGRDAEHVVETITRRAATRG